jgi:two-component system response regulator MprA
MNICEKLVNINSEGTTMSTVLIVEDDASLALSIRDWLLIEGHKTETALDGSQALSFLERQEFDLIVLDLNLPGVGGTDIAKRYRAAGGQARILMLTGRSELKDKQSGFEAGADDYVCKPCHPAEISLRIKALMRRGPSIVQPIVTVGDLELEIDAHKVTRAGEVIKLMPQEFALLEFLARHPNQIFDADALIRRVWHGASSTDTVRTHIKMLRKKLDKPGLAPLIKTIHGVGYALATV